MTKYHELPVFSKWLTIRYCCYKFVLTFILMKYVLLEIFASMTFLIYLFHVRGNFFPIPLSWNPRQNPLNLVVFLSGSLRRVKQNLPIRSNFLKQVCNIIQLPKITIDIIKIYLQVWWILIRTSFDELELGDKFLSYSITV